MILELELGELKEKLQAEINARQVLENIKMHFQQGRITHPQLFALKVSIYYSINKLMIRTNDKNKNILKKGSF